MHLGRSNVHVCNYELKSLVDSWLVEWVESKMDTCSILWAEWGDGSKYLSEANIWNMFELLKLNKVFKSNKGKGLPRVDSLGLLYLPPPLTRKQNKRFFSFFNQPRYLHICSKPGSRVWSSTFPSMRNIPFKCKSTEISIHSHTICQSLRFSSFNNNSVLFVCSKIDWKLNLLYKIDLESR